MDHAPFSALLSSALSRLPTEAFTDLVIIHTRTSPYSRMHVSLRAWEREDDVGPICLSSHDRPAGIPHVLARSPISIGYDNGFPTSDDDAQGAGHHVLAFRARADLETLPFSGIQTLRLGGSFTHEEFSRAFQAMGGLKHIRLYDYMAFSGCISALLNSTLFSDLVSLAFASIDPEKAHK